MLGDTIVALATPSGPGARAVLRISGPRAIDVSQYVFDKELPRRRAQIAGHISVRSSRLSVTALTMIAPHSFTGEDVVELHIPGSPVLVRLLQDALLHDGEARGVRAALPGEFTARACEHGRLDLAQAEGLLMLLHAKDQRQATSAVQWLRGGLADAATQVRSDLQDQLALLEVGFDFDDDDTGAVAPELWLTPLTPLAERLEQLLASLPAAVPGGEVLLVGRANAGKSSLCNALAGHKAVLVADHAGTTRDLLRVEIAPDVHLWDAPGDLDDPDAADTAALAMRERLSGRAASLLLVLDAQDPFVPELALASPLSWFGLVLTKCDLLVAGSALPPLPPAVAARLAASGLDPQDRVFRTSSTSGEGLDSLRAALVRSAGSTAVDAGGPLRSALQSAADSVRRAIDAAAMAPELAAVELQAALRALDGIGGEHSPEQLLDRIYGRFCLGK